jgi:hypothetical protein
MNGAELIAQERQRQIEVEAFTAEHDKEHPRGHLALAGAVYGLDYAMCAVGGRGNALGEAVIPLLWPWDKKWLKPTPDDPIKQLVKAGALIAAEIDKLQSEAKLIDKES